MVIGEVPGECPSSAVILRRTEERASCASVLGLRSPAIRAAIMARPEDPKMSQPCLEAVSLRDLKHRFQEPLVASITTWVTLRQRSRSYKPSEEQLIAE
jgi:hypothetical protein